MSNSAKPCDALNAVKSEIFNFEVMLPKQLIENFRTNIRFKEICIGLLSRNYAWDYEQINEFKDIINFDDMMFMKNDKVVWTLDLVEILKNKMDWGSLWKTKGLELNLPFFEKYEGLIDFSFIHHHKNIDWSNQLLDKYQDKWYWKGLSHNSIVASPRNIKKYGHLLNWEYFSKNRYLFLDKAIIDNNKDYWDWKTLCANPKFKIGHDEILEYKDNIDWRSLSRNPSMIPFILAFPEKYEWSWPSFVQNPGVVFGKSLIKFLLAQFRKQTHQGLNDVQKTFFAKLNLLRNASYRFDFCRDEWFKDEFLDVIPFKDILKRRPEILNTEEVEEHLDINDFDKVLPYRIVQKLSLSYLNDNISTLPKFSGDIFRNGNINMNFLDNYIQERDWFQLAFNESFEWDIDFLVKNLEKFESNYGLSQNKRLFDLMFSEATKEDINSLLSSY